MVIGGPEQALSYPPEDDFLVTDRTTGRTTGRKKISKSLFDELSVVNLTLTRFGTVFFFPISYRTLFF